MRQSWVLSRLSAGTKVGIVLMFCAVCTMPALLAQAAAPRWSWEETLEPLDILEFVSELPYDEWVEIDEVTVRRLFEDLIRRAQEQMEIEGGHFERMLRERFFYFTPEREYYYPPYEPDPSQRRVLFPVKIMRERNERYGAVVRITLGRYSDDERDLTAVFRDEDCLVGFTLKQYRYYPGETGPKKTRQTTLSIFDARVLCREIWLSADGSLFIGVKTLFEYTRGNPEPVVDNTVGEVPLDLSGVEILFDVPYSWFSHDPALFQTYNGLVNLCRLQLNRVRGAEELERLLWRELFYYDDGVDYFSVEVEYANVKRLHTLTTTRAEFLFDVGNAYTARYIHLVLSKDFGSSGAGYEWGIETITLTRNVLVGAGEVGQEEKVLTFRRTTRGMQMELWVTVQNAAGTVLSRHQLGQFTQRP